MQPNETASSTKVSSDRRATHSLSVERLGQALFARRIEFLGVSGVGKSTLHRHVMAELEQSGVDAVEINDAVYSTLRAGMQDRIMGPLMKYVPRRIGRMRYRQVALRSQDHRIALRRFMLDQPDTMIAILRGLDDRRDIAPNQDLLFSWILDFLWKYQIMADSQESSHYLVLDEGFANRAISLFGYGFSSDDEPLLRQYIESIPKPDLVIAVTADAEEAASRSTGRGRFSHLSEQEAVEHTRDAAKCAATTVRFLKDRGVDVQEMPNESSVTAASAHVRRIIRDWLDPA